MPLLDGQTALITGASSGIGAATARMLAREGAAVVLAARRENRLRGLADEIEAEGGRALAVPLDVTDRAACARAVEATERAFGGIDVLVNNAGIMPLSFVKNLRLDEWLEMVDVNVNGVLLMTAAALPGMIERKRGHVVNVSSVAGRRVFVGGAVYCGTKHFVSAFSEGLRMELAPRQGIRVTSIEPGAVATELPRRIADEEFKSKSAEKWDFKILESEDVAEAVRYAVTAPEHVDVSQVLLMPRGQRL
jgi:NADP-dependent 3-hydroxy acid dehydrogenase YdfG